MPAPKCPACGKTMVFRKGKRGDFWGCQDYPRCKATRDGSDVPAPCVECDKLREQLAQERRRNNQLLAKLAISEGKKRGISHRPPPASDRRPVLGPRELPDGAAEALDREMSEWERSMDYDDELFG